MNREQRQLMLMVGLYGASPAKIAEQLNRMVGQVYKPRRMGMNDRQIAEAKRHAMAVTANSSLGYPVYGSKAMELTTRLIKDRFKHLMRQPSNFEGAQFFKDSGDFTNCFRRGI